MSLDLLFRGAVQALDEYRVLYAVAGGMAVSLYRDSPRMTMDVDLVIWAESDCSKIAVTVLESLGLDAGVARKADLAGGPHFAIRQRNTAACMVVGRSADQSHAWGVDILLPSMPWARDAVSRAQDNRVDFGFGAVPTLTLEDMILAKLHALGAGIPRPKDMDDLQSIYHANSGEVDAVYLAAQMKRFAFVVPRAAEAFCPKELLALSRDVKRQLRRN